MGVILSPSTIKIGLSSLKDAIYSKATTLIDILPSFVTQDFVESTIKEKYNLSEAFSKLLSEKLTQEAGLILKVEENPIELLRIPEIKNYLINNKEDRRQLYKIIDLESRLKRYAMFLFIGIPDSVFDDPNLLNVISNKDLENAIKDYNLFKILDNVVLQNFLKDHPELLNQIKQRFTQIKTILAIGATTVAAYIGYSMLSENEPAEIDYSINRFQFLK